MFQNEHSRRARLEGLGAWREVMLAKQVLRFLTRISQVGFHSFVNKITAKLQF